MERNVSRENVRVATAQWQSQRVYVNTICDHYRRLYYKGRINQKELCDNIVRVLFRVFVTEGGSDGDLPAVAVDQRVRESSP